MKKSKYNVKWILAHTRKCRLQMIVYAALTMFMPVIQLLFAYFMKMFIDIAVGNSDNSLLSVALYSITAIILGGAVMLINSVLAKSIYGITERELRTELMRVITTRKLLDISKQHSGELMTKLTADVQAASLCYPIIVENIIGGSVSALFSAAALFFLNWKIAVILLVLTPLMMFLMGMLTPQIQKISALDKANDETNRSIMQEDLNRLTLIKAYSMQIKVVEKIERTYENKLKSGMILGAWEGFAAFLGALSGNVMSLVTLGLGSYFVLNGETTVGSLIMIVQLLNYIVTPVAKFPVAVAQIGQAAASAERIGGIYELPEEQGNSSVLANADELIAENLCFSYSQENILNGIDLSFRKGEVTGIIGKSGSGKSTLLKLLMGLYSPTDGTVKLKCKDKTISGEDIISQVAYVPPEDYLFSGTIAENIAMSDNERDTEKMSAAAASANIFDHIQSLANGFETVIGEGGNTVSSGQAQRIAIARAIYKRGEIFIFDEPTANLDQETVDVFQSTVKKLAQDNICIIVTHDTSTVGICDKVYTLENGRAQITALTAGKISL